MPDELNFGIARHAGEFVDEVKTKTTTDVAERRNRVGTIKKVFPHNTTTDISISGGGTPPLAVGAVADHGISGITGGVVVVKEAEHTDKNTDFDEFSISAKHYPEATLGTAAAAPAGGEEGGA